MKRLLLIALMAGGLAFVPAQRSDAQVSVGIGFGYPSYGYRSYPYGYGYYPYGYYRPYRSYGYYNDYDYGYPYYANYGYDDGDYYGDGGCYIAQQRVLTPYGWRLRSVQVCN